MRFYSEFIIFILLASSFACSSAKPKLLTPLETLKAYGNAFKKKDTTTMKRLLSQETLKIHEQEAKAQNINVDDVVKRDSLFAENQTTAEFRNEITEDDKATIEMKDSMGIWNKIHFIKEDGVWKIDRRSLIDEVEKISEESNDKLDQIINQGRQP